MQLNRRCDRILIIVIVLSLYCQLLTKSYFFSSKNNALLCMFKKSLEKVRLRSRKIIKLRQWWLDYQQFENFFLVFLNRISQLFPIESALLCYFSKDFTFFCVEHIYWLACWLLTINLPSLVITYYGNAQIV